MTGTISTRWFWSDWLSDPALRACSYAARGLWIDTLCIIAANKGKDYGLLVLNKKPIQPATLARMTNGSEAEIKILLAELEENGVFSRDRKGAIYCRRLVRTQKNRENGRLGGNPKLLNNKAKPNSLNHLPKAHIPKPIPEPEPAVDSLIGRQRDFVPLPADAYEQFKQRYPKRKGANPSKPARAALARLLKAGAALNEILTGAENYAAECRRDKKDGTQYVAQAVTWLNQSRFVDYQQKGNGHDEGDRSGGLVEAGRRLIAKLDAGRVDDEGCRKREQGETRGEPGHRDVRLLSQR